MRELATVMAGLLGVVLTGCVGVTPLPKRTRTPQGIEEKTVDLAFLQPGHTMRAEVKEKLKLIDTGYQGDRYFLGRWSSSSSGGWYFVPTMGPTDVIGAARSWKSGNLLVEFDEQGVVRNYKRIPDTHLVRELAPVAALGPAPAPDPQELAVKYLSYYKPQTDAAKIILSTSTFEFVELGSDPKRHTFVLPARDVLSITTSVLVGDPDPVYSMHTLHFAQNLKPLGGPQGKTIQLEMNTPDLVRLLSFISNAARR